MAEHEKTWSTSKQPPPNRAATIATIIVAIAVCPILVVMYFRMEILANNLGDARADIVELSQLNASLKETLVRINDKLTPDEPKLENPDVPEKTGETTKELRQLSAHLQKADALPSEAAGSLADGLEEVAEYLELWASFEKGVIDDKAFSRARHNLKDDARRELSRFFSEMEDAIRQIARKRKEEQDRIEKEKKEKERRLRVQMEQEKKEKEKREMKRKEREQKNPKPGAIDEVF